MADINHRLERLSRRDELTRRARQRQVPDWVTAVGEDVMEVVEVVSAVVRRHPGMSIMLAPADGRPGSAVIRVSERNGDAEVAPVNQGVDAGPAGPPPAIAEPAQGYPGQQYPDPYAQPDHFGTPPPYAGQFAGAPVPAGMPPNGGYRPDAVPTEVVPAQPAHQAVAPGMPTGLPPGMAPSGMVPHGMPLGPPPNGQPNGAPSGPPSGPQSMPQSMPQPMPQSVPQAMAQSMAQPMQQPVPHSMPQPVPQPVPQRYPTQPTVALQPIGPDDTTPSGARPEPPAQGYHRRPGPWQDPEAAETYYNATVENWQWDR